jgi:transposase-like protein
MEKSSKRGKIPQSDWPLIMARYEAGETLSSIARTYDCSPPAISYVISRSRARHSDGEVPRAPAPAPVGEPQLIKAANGEATAGESNRPPPATPAEQLPLATHVHPAAAPSILSAADQRTDIRPHDGNGFARPPGGDREAQLSGPVMRGAPPPVPRPAVPHQPSGAANGDQRPRLHLSLGNGHNGAPPLEPRPPERPYTPPAPQPPVHGAAERQPWAPAPLQRNPGLADQTRYGAMPNPSTEPARNDQHNAYGRGNGQPGQRKEAAGSYIDQELRARVDGDIAAFLAAFDAALAEDSQESRAALREATDRLLRAGARTRIELERLEARMPLPARDPGRQSEPVWRQR